MRFLLTCLVILWMLGVPVALAYGQYWSVVNILLGDYGIVSTILRTLAFDAASLLIFLAWAATLPSSSD